MYDLGIRMMMCHPNWMILLIDTEVVKNTAKTKRPILNLEVHVNNCNNLALITKFMFHCNSFML